MRIKSLSVVIILLFLFSCGQDKAAINQDDEINIRLVRDPQRINPFLSPSAVGREIFLYVYSSLADFHPDNLELYPVMLTHIPEGYVKEVNGEALMHYDMVLKPDLKWSDGVPITNKDYAFTMKMIKHPMSKANAWKPYFSDLRAVILDPDDPTKFTVTYNKDYMLSLEAATTVNLLPQHIYDAEARTSTLSLQDISVETYSTQDSAEIKIVEGFNNSANDPTDIVQSGPYELTAYESNQYVILDRIDNHWTQNYPNNVFLQSKPSRMIFKIVPDETTALTMAKDGALDLLTLRDSKTFLDLKSDETLNKDWTFHVPQLMRYYYIALNNKDVILSDKAVRQALARLIDIPDLIESIEGGLGIQTIGHFHPSKAYYNETLPPILYDPSKAAKLLDDSGWQRDKEGLRTKTINGKKIPLELDLILTGSALSKNISLLFQESAKKAGIQINLVTKKSALMTKENLYTGDYDMAMLMIGMDAAPDDPYRRWHSDNIGGSKGNVYGYNNPEVDSQIELLRLQNSSEARLPYYLKIQELMYEDQPVLFLYCPMNKIIINKRYKALTTPKRPGYMANTFS